MAEIARLVLMTRYWRRQEVDAWLKGTLQGVDMATAGDFVALAMFSLLLSQACWTVTN